MLALLALVLALGDALPHTNSISLETRARLIVQPDLSATFHSLDFTTKSDGTLHCFVCFTALGTNHVFRYSPDAFFNWGQTGELILPTNRTMSDCALSEKHIVVALGSANPGDTTSIMVYNVDEFDQPFLTVPLPQGDFTVLSTVYSPDQSLLALCVHPHGLLIYNVTDGYSLVFNSKDQPLAIAGCAGLGWSMNGMHVYVNGNGQLTRHDALTNWSVTVLYDGIDRKLPGAFREITKDPSGRYIILTKDVTDTCVVIDTKAGYQIVGDLGLGRHDFIGGSVVFFENHAIYSASHLRTARDGRGAFLVYERSSWIPENTPVTCLKDKDQGALFSAGVGDRLAVITRIGGNLVICGMESVEILNIEVYIYFGIGAFGLGLIVWLTMKYFPRSEGPWGLRPRPHWGFAMFYISFGTFSLLLTGPIVPSILQEYFNGGNSCEGALLRSQGCQLAASSGSTTLGMVDGIGAGVNFLAAVWFGRLSDVHGRKYYLVLQAACSLLPYIALWLYTQTNWTGQSLLDPVTSMNIYLFLRASFAGLAKSPTLAYVYVSDCVPDQLQRKKAMVQVTAGAGISMILGPLATKVLPRDVCLALPMAFGLFLIFFSLVIMPESLPKRERKQAALEHRAEEADPNDAHLDPKLRQTEAFQSVMRASMVGSLNEGPPLVGMGRCQRFLLHKDNPLRPLVVFTRKRSFMMLAGVMVFVTLGSTGLPDVNPFYLNVVYHAGIDVLSTTMLASGCVLVVWQMFFLPVLIQRLSAQRAGLVCLFLAIVGVIFFGFSNITLLEIFSPLSPLAYSLTGITAGLASSSVGPFEQGAIVGAIQAVATMAAIIAPTIMSGLFAAFTTTDGPFFPQACPIFAIVCYLIGALILSYVRVDKWKPLIKPQFPEVEDPQAEDEDTDSEQSRVRTDKAEPLLGN